MKIIIFQEICIVFTSRGNEHSSPNILHWLHEHVHNILTVNQSSVEWELKMICDWILRYFRTCRLVQLHSIRVGMPAGMNAPMFRCFTGHEQNTIIFCTRKSWQSFYQEEINRTLSCDNHKYIYMCWWKSKHMTNNIKICSRTLMFAISDIYMHIYTYTHTHTLHYITLHKGR
jgi:hypothetical protein